MGKKKILLIVGGVVLLLVIGAAGFILTQGPGQPFVVHLSLGPQTAAAAAPAAEAPAAAAPAEPVASLEEPTGIRVDLGSKVVNLADPGGYRYLKVGLVLEVEVPGTGILALKDEERKQLEEKITARVTEQRPLIDDAIVGLLSDKAFSDIFSLAGKEQLKEQLAAEITTRLGDITVSHVYFTDFLIQ